MSRVIAVAILSALLVPASSGAKRPSTCKRLHGHAKKACLRKKAAVAKPKTIPVMTTVLDGSTLTTSAGTFGITGAIKGSLPGQAQMSSSTTVTDTEGNLAVAPGAPCSGLQLAPYSAYAPPPGVMLLNADGTVFSSLHLDLPDCGGPSILLLAGKVGGAGLNSLTLDSIPGPVTAHLVAKVDLSG